MIWSDRTVLGTTFAVVVIAILNFFVPDWVRQIGLLSMAIGSVALGLLVLWRSGLISFGHALYFGLGAYALRLFQWLGRHQIDVASARLIGFEEGRVDGQVFQQRGVEDGQIVTVADLRVDSLGL